MRSSKIEVVLLFIVVVAVVVAAVVIVVAAIAIVVGVIRIVAVVVVVAVAVVVVHCNRRRDLACRREPYSQTEANKLKSHTATNDSITSQQRRYKTVLESHDKNILESATLLSLPRRRHETNASKSADLTQSNERQHHFAAVTF